MTDPFDDVRAADEMTHSSSKNDSLSAPLATKANSSRSSAGTSHTGGSFGIPIFDDGDYAHGVPLHSYIDVNVEGSRLSWYDEDIGQSFHMDAQGFPVSADGQRMSLNSDQTDRFERSRRSMLARRSAYRQSTASSVGGFSVFDGIPFQLGQETMPANAAENVAAIRTAELSPHPIAPVSSQAVEEEEESRSAGAAKTSISTANATRDATTGDSATNNTRDSSSFALPTGASAYVNTSLPNTAESDLDAATSTRATRASLGADLRSADAAREGNTGRELASDEEDMALDGFKFQVSSSK